MPAYGCSEHLGECLESLLGQSMGSEVIVSTSTPNASLERIARSYGVKLVQHGPNRGIGHDWNQALRATGARWVTLAHQDDVYFPMFAERSVEALAAASAPVLAFTAYAELLDGVLRSRTLMLGIKRVLLEAGFLGRKAVSGRAKLRTLRLGSPIPCPAVTFDRRNADLAFRTDLKVNLDWEAWVRLAKAPGAFVYVREVLMAHRIHGASETTSAIHDGTREREDRMMFDMLWPRYLAPLVARAYRFSYLQKGLGQ